MASPCPTPRRLVEALHERGDEARQQLWQVLGHAAGQLVGECIARHGLSHNPQRLTDYALHSVETYLRTRPQGEFEGLSWTAFVGSCLIYLAKLTFRPSVVPSERIWEPDALPEGAGYQTQAIFLPFEKIGDVRVGGDWCGGTRARDGSLWVIIADVTGHGYCAYLLANSMPYVWGACWDAAPSHCCPPNVLLEGLHRQLEGCLPEGLYVEGTLVRMNPNGEVAIAPAGGTRLLLRRRGERSVAWHRLSGSWLGLAPPQAEDQRTWILDTEDEIVLGTDGLFDQIATIVPSGDPLVDLIANRGPSSTLFVLVHHLLQEGLRTHPQVDDITMVTLRRRTPHRSEARAVSG